MYNNKIVMEDMVTIFKQSSNLEKFKNKNILITGANGMLAAYCMYFLMFLNDNKNMNIKIFALVRNVNKLKENTNYDERNDIIPIVQDVNEKIKISENVDYIIHMASNANPKSITEKPVEIINSNVLGTLNVLELAKEKNAKLFFPSTREIYGKVDDSIKKIKETDMGVLDNTQLRSCYPESKKMAENLIISYAYQYGIKYKIARIAHVYGPGMNISNDGRIMSDLIGNAVKNENIILKSKGEDIRAFCYVTDAINGLLKIILNDNENEIYNLSNETEEIKVVDLAYLIKELLNNKVDVVFNIKENNNEYVKFKRTMLDTTKLEGIGWNPSTNLKSGIKRTIEYFKLL